MGVHSSNNLRGLSTTAYDPRRVLASRKSGHKSHVYGFYTEGVKLKKSATIAAIRHLSGEHFDLREQAQILNQSITT